MRLEEIGAPAGRKAVASLEKLLSEVVSDIPESQKEKSRDPEAAARGLSASAARRAAVTTGALALPYGPLGVLTIIPDLVAVWRLQAQLVADIAAVYGKTGRLDKALMTYCLFRHVSSDAVKDIVARAGERMIVSPMTIISLYRMLRVVVGDFLSLMAGRFMVRWLPIIGIASVAAYSYRDTKRVGDTAIETFAGELAPARKRRHGKKAD